MKWDSLAFGVGAGALATILFTDRDIFISDMSLGDMIQNIVFMAIPSVVAILVFDNTGV
jgi:hypothetical protein